MKSKPAYIVIDTNVLISAGLLPHSKSAQVLAIAVERFVIAQYEGIEILSPAIFFDRFQNAIT
jgi:predicted nucleic acid-binding protein